VVRALWAARPRLAVAQGGGHPEAPAVIVGTDGFALLEAVYAAEVPSWLREVPAVQTLRRLWL
jgi:hypothetical protein